MVRTLLLIVLLVLSPVRVDGWEGSAGIRTRAFTSSTSMGTLTRPFREALGQPGGAGETGALQPPTGPSASPSPAATQGPLAGAGVIVLGLIIGAFLLLRTKLLRRRP